LAQLFEAHCAFVVHTCPFAQLAFTTVWAVALFVAPSESVATKVKV
jgi:hypothetical protein